MMNRILDVCSRRNARYIELIGSITGVSVMASPRSPRTLVYLLTTVVVTCPRGVLSDLYQLTCSSSKQFIGENGTMTCTFQQTYPVEFSYWFRGKYNDSKAQICLCHRDGNCSLFNRKFRCEVSSTSVTLLVRDSTRSEEGYYLFEINAHDVQQSKLVYYTVQERPTEEVIFRVNTTEVSHPDQQTNVGARHPHPAIWILLGIPLLGILVGGLIFKFKLHKRINCKRGSSRSPRLDKRGEEQERVQLKSTATGD